LLEKTKRVNGRGPAARLRIGVGGHKDAANAEALADFVSGVDSVARTNQTNIHEHHVRALQLGDADRLIGRSGDGDHDMPHRLQQPFGVEKNKNLTLEDQDAWWACLKFWRVPLLGGDAPAVWTRRGQPKMHRLWPSLQ